MCEVRYACNVCEKLHKVERDAKVCCPVEVITYYLCDVCQSHFSRKSWAKECCKKVTSFLYEGEDE